jgi:ribosomal protein S18 acetylase RimI-like enzyme
MEEGKITIETLTEVTPEIFGEIKKLAQKIGLNYKELTENDLREMVLSSGTTLLVARAEKKIVGMITLLVFRIPYVKKAYLDDLVIDETYRGHGIAKKLMHQALNLAKEKGASYIDLTARPRRAEGNSLYESLGFQKRETNVYRLLIDYGEV